MILPFSKHNLPWFLAVAGGLAILNHLNSISGTELIMGWSAAGVFLIHGVWP